MKSFRPDKMASSIRSIVSDMIDNRLHDPRISSFTSVTRVEVSGDLQMAKVYVSVMGSDTEERKTLAGLNHARGRVQQAIAHGITARHCPRVSFIADDSLKKAARIIQLIDENVPRPMEEEGKDNHLPDMEGQADGAMT